MKMTFDRLYKIYEILKKESWGGYLCNEIERLDGLMHESQDSASIFLKQQNILVSLEAGRFHLGVYPFEGEEGLALARIILLNAHILHIDNNIINKNTAAAIEKMLESNFHAIHDNECKLAKAATSMKDNYTQKGVVDYILSNGRDLHRLQYMEKILEYRQIPSEETESVNNFINHFKLINMEVLKAVKPFFEFAAIFCGNRGLSYEANAILTSIAFEDAGTAFEYLKKHGDYKNGAILQEGLYGADINEISLLNLSEEDLASWRGFNKDLDSRMMKYFFMADKLNQEIDINEIKEDELSVNARYACIAIEAMNKFDIGIKSNKYKSQTSSVFAPDAGDYINEKIYLKALCKQNNMVYTEHSIVPDSKYPYNRIFIDDLYEKVLDSRKKSDNLPDINIQLEDADLVFKKIQPGDPKTLFIDAIIDCKQKYFTTREDIERADSMRQSMFRENIGYFTLSKQKEIKAAFFIWVGLDADQNEVLVLDKYLGDIDVAGIYTKLILKPLFEYVQEGGADNSNFKSFYINSSFCYISCTGVEIRAKNYPRYNYDDQYIKLEGDNINAAYGAIMDLSEDYINYNDYFSSNTMFLKSWFYSLLASNNINYNDSYFIKNSIEPNLAVIYKLILEQEMSTEELFDSINKSELPTKLVSIRFCKVMENSNTTMKILHEYDSGSDSTIDDGLDGGDQIDAFDDVELMG